ncbi:hypothetical protein [Ruegeria arenilitoris]|uniref:hypothetical protein n=1 Tax=Ruegeria arenilitoris TaxID=1173585 RepID=UPI001480C352|nr:hypothetical protein [Ruegeria arenilitoris]
MGIGDFRVRQILRSTISERTQSELIGAVLSLRAEVEQALKQAKLDTFIHRFDASDYNPAIPLGINLFSGLATASTTSKSLAADPVFLETMEKFDLVDALIDISLAALGNFHAMFGSTSTDHTLFKKLGITSDTYQLLLAASHNDFSGSAKDQLSHEDKATLISLPFVLSADQMDFAFVRSFQLRSLEIRENSGPEILKALNTLLHSGWNRSLPAHQNGAGNYDLWRNIGLFRCKRKRDRRNRAGYVAIKWALQQISPGDFRPGYCIRWQQHSDRLPRARRAQPCGDRAAGRSDPRKRTCQPKLRNSAAYTR